MPDGEEVVAIGGSDKPLLFISHKHSDKDIADALSAFIRGRTGGRLRVFQSSSFFAEGPRVGRTLSREIRKAVAESCVVILVYTSQDLDWNFCMWECGIASDPETPEAKIIVLQCGVDVPTLFTDQLHVRARNLLDIQKFTNELLTDPDFLPGRKGPLTELTAQSQDVQQAATDLHGKLLPLLPDTSDGAWMAWPYIQFQMDLATASQVASAVRDGKVDRAKELVITRCTVLREDKAADRIFGVAEFRESSFGALLDMAKRLRESESAQWFESLLHQLTDATAERLPTLRWATLLDRAGAARYAPVLVSWRRTNSPRSVLFDVYFVPSSLAATGEGA